MALEGNAKDFGLSEIFQLIAIQKKSGLLQISGEQNMAVFFKDGAIISTRDRRGLAQDPLKDFLIRYGFVDHQAMNNLHRIQAETRLDLTEILISEKYYTSEELSTIFNSQIQESLQEALTWPKSFYKFISGSHVLQGVTTYTTIKVEGLLMESMRRIDELPELKRIFTSEQMILKRLLQDPLPDLDENEASVYNLLADEMSLGELISRARMARYCTYEACKNLLEKGLLEILNEPVPIEVEMPETVIDDHAQRQNRILPLCAAIALLVASFAVGEFVVPFVSPPGWSARSTVRPTADDGERRIAASITELSLRQAEASIREGLEEYFSVKGSYPITLEVLVVRSFVPEQIIDAAQRCNLRYRLEHDGLSYTLKGD